MKNKTKTQTVAFCTTKIERWCPFCGQKIITANAKVKACPHVIASGTNEGFEYVAKCVKHLINIDNDPYREIRKVAKQIRDSFIFVENAPAPDWIEAYLALSPNKLN